MEDSFPDFHRVWHHSFDSSFYCIIFCINPSVCLGHERRFEILPYEKRVPEKRYPEIQEPDCSARIPDAISLLVRWSDLTKYSSEVLE